MLQNIIVAVIIIVAVAYLVHRAIVHLFCKGGDKPSGCASCAGCELAEKCSQRDKTSHAGE